MSLHLLTVPDTSGITLTGTSNVVRFNTVMLGDTGSSAYQIAVSHGFIGTELEWLDSLKGLPGSAGTTYITLTTGESLGGHRACIISNGLAYYADKDTLTHADRVIGITTGASGIGTQVNIQSTGELTGFAGLTAGNAVYLSNLGTPTQTVPTTGFILQLGVAKATDTVLININQSIIQV